MRARVLPVTSAEDPQLVEVAGLTDAQSRSRTEAEHGCFVIEGLGTLVSAVDSRYQLRRVLVSESKLHRVVDVVGHLDVDIHVASPDLMASVTGFPIHRGVVASAARLPLPAVRDVLAGARRIVVAEALNDHENLGALFRNAAALGIDGVLLDPTCADPLYRRSVRVSVGQVLRVPWTTLDPADGLGALGRAGFETVALTPSGDRTVRDLGPAKRRAWLVGAEGPGLRTETMDACDERACIPMTSGVDSLNVATAAAVAFALDTGR